MAEGTQVMWGRIARPTLVGIVGLVVGASGAARGDGLDYFQRQLEPFTEARVRRGRSRIRRPSCMKGKSILSIPVSSANPFTANIEKAMAAAAKEVGFKFTTWENQGQSSQWVQGMDTAVNQKVSLIDLLAGTDPRVLVPQVQAAQAAKIPVIASHYNGVEQTARREKVRRRRRADRLRESWSASRRLGDRQNKGPYERPCPHRDGPAFDRLDDVRHRGGTETLRRLQNESDELSGCRLGHPHHAWRAGRAPRRSHGQLHHRDL